MCNTPTTGAIRPEIPDLPRALLNVQSSACLLECAVRGWGGAEAASPDRLSIVRRSLRTALEAISSPRAERTDIEAEADTMTAIVLDRFPELADAQGGLGDELLRSIITDAITRGCRLAAVSRSNDEQGGAA